MPKFSIIVPALNAAATLGETLSALQAQTFPDWEAIVIDDGSTDGTAKIVHDAARSDPRIRLEGNPGQGPSDARNYGAAEFARAPILAFCDADDIWTPHKLAELDSLLCDASVDGAFGQIAFFSTRPQESRTRSTVPQGALTVPMLMGENPVCTMSNVTVRRDAFLASGGFDGQMVHNEDLEWLIRLVGGGARLVGVDSLQVYYRTSPSGLSADIPAMCAGRRKALRTAERYGHKPDRAAEAIHMRYLARRALRLDLAPGTALRLTLAGLRYSPRGFCMPARRGLATALGALIAPVLPRALRHSLFAR